MSTTRPLAMEMTGTSREMSGKTVPVAFSSAAASIWPALTMGNLLTSCGSMVITFMSETWTTFAGGGAPSPSSFLPQAEMPSAMDAPITRIAGPEKDRSKEKGFVIGGPHVQQLG